MRIALDMDDTICDLLNPWLARFNKDHGTSWDKTQITQWAFQEDLGTTYDVLLKYLTPDIYMEVQPIEHALETVNAIRDMGHEIVYVTSCHDALTWLAKSAWLIDKKFLLPKDLAFPVGKWAEYKTKAQVAERHNIPVLVDDNVDHCLDWPGTALLMQQPHNYRSIYCGKRLKKIEDLVLEIKHWPKQLQATAEGWVGGNTQYHQVGSIVEYSGPKPPELKPTNPKDAIASTKLPLGFVSPIVKAYACIAHYLGNVKYGAWNYRAGGARASVYRHALDRHMDRWWEGQADDPVDGTPHLANALACINILIECSEGGNLEDDRPPSRITVLERIYDRFEGLMLRIQDMYKDRKPKHYSIGDAV